jgi:hypothetical protein
MQSETLIMIFIGCTAAAVVLQLVVLASTMIATRKTAQRLEALANEIKSRALPTLETAQAMIVELRPKIESITENVSQSTSMVRSQVERLDGTVGELVDRTRLQVIRADELVNRTMDRVEQTTEMVQKTVVSPLRQVSALLQGLSVGIEALLGKHKKESREGVAVPQDEMFI